MVDPRFFAPFDLGDAVAKGAQIRQHQQQQDDRKRLADLIPQAIGRGGIAEDGAVKSQEDALTQLYTIDPRLAMQLDDRQREQAKAELADIGAAVRWADSPEKWQYVQQHYGQRGVDLSPYRFEDRERGMVALGKMSEYLNSQPKHETVTIDGVVMDKNTGQPLFESPYDRIIAGPDGSFYRVPRMGIGRGGGMPQQAQPQPAQPPAGPQVGAVVQGYRFKGGNPNDRSSWEPVGGQTAQPSGPFQPTGY